MAERSEIEPFELQALLSADGDGPAPRIDAAAEARLIDNALDAVLGTAPAATNVTSLNPRARNKRKLAWALAAAFVITGSAAAMYTAQRVREADAQHERAAGAARAAHAPAQAPIAAPPASQPAPLEPAPQALAPATVPEPAAGTASTSVHTKARTPNRVDARGDDLLKRANHLRGDGAYREAESAYQKVVSADPHGAAAYAARVAAAGLRLERLSDPRGALRLYGQALQQAPDGALAPEIHEGMANAFRKLDRARDEQQMLRALLREQPSGPAAERARARLAVLDAHP